MTKKPFTNGADDADWLQALEEVEAITVEAMAEAKERFDAEMAKLKADAKRKTEMLCRELGLDKGLFKARLADRDEDRKHFAKKQKRAAKMPADKIEVWCDLAGQTSFLPPGEPTPEGKVETLAERANRLEQEARQKITEEELAEGEAVFGKTIGGEGD